MLHMLRRSNLSAAELAQPFRMTQASISEHIRALRVAGLISYRSRGAQHVYSLVQTRLRPVEEWIEAFKRKS